MALGERGSVADFVRCWGGVSGAYQGNRMNVFIIYLTGVCPQPTSQTLSTPSLLVGFLDRIMEKEGPQQLAGCSFHENGQQLLCGLELISVHVIALGKSGA